LEKLYYKNALKLFPGLEEAMFALTPEERAEFDEYFAQYRHGYWGSPEDGAMFHYAMRLSHAPEPDAKKFRRYMNYFVSKGMNLEYYTGGFGSTPLLAHVARSGNVEFAEVLISKGANVNSSIHGISPLSAAARAGDIDMVKFLVSKGADAGESIRGTTALLAAVGGDNIEVVKFLVSQGANANAALPGGRTPLDVARERGQTAIVEYLEGRGDDR